MMFRFMIRYREPKAAWSRMPNGWLKIDRFVIDRDLDNLSATAGSKDATVERLHNYLTAYVHHTKDAT